VNLNDHGSDAVEAQCKVCHVALYVSHEANCGQCVSEMNKRTVTT